LQQRVITKTCKASGCGELIRWHTIPNKGGAGYWVNDSNEERHLCPSWQDPRAASKELDIDKYHSIMEEITNIKRELIDIRKAIRNV
jgi:hypothetical protein